MCIIAGCGTAVSRSVLGPCTGAIGCLSPLVLPTVSEDETRDRYGIDHIDRRLFLRVTIRHLGNTRGMNGHFAQPSEPVEAAWAEAAALVQADIDAAIHDEARGLVVAEMADVRLHERLQALSPRQGVEITTIAGGRFEGRVTSLGCDHLVLECADMSVVVALTAIAVLRALPRVIHDESAPVASGGSWRHALRAALGVDVSVDTSVTCVRGRLSWVGHDHLDVIDSDGQVSVPWHAVASVLIPNFHRSPDSGR